MTHNFLSWWRTSGPWPAAWPRQTAWCRGADPGCRPSPPGCRPSPPGCRPSLPGCRHSPPGCRYSPPGCRPSPTRCRPSPPGCRPSPSGPSSPRPRGCHWGQTGRTPVSSHQCFGSGFRCLLNPDPFLEYIGPFCNLVFGWIWIRVQWIQIRNLATHPVLLIQIHWILIKMQKVAPIRIRIQVQAI